jgi:hypothetical protein
MLEKIRDNVARTPSIVLFKKPIRNITWWEYISNLFNW